MEATKTIEKEVKQIDASVKLERYLNLIVDFTHNITDGLAMSSSFYASPIIGATTTGSLVASHTRQAPSLSPG
jgi:zinc transporter ZupT